MTQKTYRGVVHAGVEIKFRAPHAIDAKPNSLFLISPQVHAAQTLLKESGPKAFFRGWAWRTGRMVFQCFLFDACKNHLSPVFFPHHFRD